MYTRITTSKKVNTMDHMRKKMEGLFNLPIVPSEMEGKYCFHLPKVELHAHLNGSLSVTTIGKLVRLHKQTFPDESMPPAEDIFRQFETFDEVYAIFKCAQALVDHPQAVTLATSCVLKEFAVENVHLVELRSTLRSIKGKMTKHEYIKAMIEALEGQTETKAALIVSIDRRRSTEEAFENVDLAIEYNKTHPNVVVGVDLSGDARVNQLQSFYPALIKAKENGLKVSCHYAEVPNMEEELHFVLDHPTFKPDRFGHSTCVHPSLGGNAQIWEKFRELRIPTEICLTSNDKCKSVSSLQDSHLVPFYQGGLPVCVCTDDKGAFFTSSTEEHENAMEVLKLNEDEIFNLSFKSIDYAFVPDDIKELLRSKFVEWKQQQR